MSQIGRMPITIPENVEITNSNNIVSVKGKLGNLEFKFNSNLDINISEKLKNEGLAREFINRVQNHRKENLFNVTDKIEISILNNNGIQNIFKNLLLISKSRSKVPWESSVP